MPDILRIAVCDDEILVLPYLASSIREAFQGFGYFPELENFSSAKALLAAVSRGRRFTAAFLDIELPGIDGIELARQLALSSPETFCIFVSGREDRVFDAFQTHPFAFVRKGSFQDDLRSAVKDLAARLLPPEDPARSFRDSLGKSHTLNLNETIYVAAQDKYLAVVTERGHTLVRYTLAELERVLEGCRFLRVHKSYLANYRFIRRLDAKEVILEDGTALPLSRRRRAQVQKQFIDCSSGPEKEIFQLL